MTHILGQLCLFLLIFPNKITKEAGKCGPWGQNLMHNGKQKLVYETLIKTKFYAQDEPKISLSNSDQNTKN
jgi:hypothetical protein